MNSVKQNKISSHL